MSHWTYIRGWLELTEEMLPVVRETIERSVGDAVSAGVADQGDEVWNDGWIIPDEPRVLIYYAFYGRDVRIQSVPFVRFQMEQIARISTTTEDGDEDQPLGMIHVDEEEGQGSKPLVWEIKEGHLREYPRAPAV
jgi:hypothetical protein